jgi:hypothetical protein
MTSTNANELDTAPSSARHPGPPLGVLAIVHTILFLSGLYFVVTFSGGPHFPGPWEPADVIARYFREQPSAVVMCAFLQFGAAVPLGLFVASTVSRLQFLGVRAAGVVIALFGGFMTAIDMAAAAMILWVMAYPGIAQDAALVRALYYVSYAFGGPGFSVPFGLFVAGVSVAAGFAKLIPKWLVGFGLVLAVIGELSWFNLVSPKALPLIPLTRFPGFVWLIASGFLLPNRGR